MVNHGDDAVAVASDQTFEAPLLEGKHVRLRVVTPADYGFLQTVEMNSDLAFRWRHRGATPSPEQWTQSLWTAVLAQHLILGRVNDRPLGLASVYKPNFQDQFAYVGVVRFGHQTRSPLVLLGTALFLEYVFTCWGFRKLYLETPEYNYEQFEHGEGRLFEVEARLRGHSYYGGRYWDQLTLAIYRDVWRGFARSALQLERPPEPRTVRLRFPAAKAPGL